MKKIMIITAIILFGLGLVGCQTPDTLSVFEGATSDEVSYDNVETLSLNLASEDMITSEKIEYIRSLYDDIQVLHAHNILIRVENRANWYLLKEDVKIFRDLELTLTESDKEILLGYKDELTVRRLEVKETIGDIKDLFLELKGNYDLEHIDLIITNFEAIKDILQMRYDHMDYLKQALLVANTLVLGYIEA